jgi:hypothetical protein
MPGCSKQRNPKGIEITFEEDTHKYYSIIDNETIEYISGTTFIHKFFPKFDPTGSIAKRCALKEGITVDEIRKKWKKSGEEASSFGTKIHETMEDIILGNPLRNTPNNEKEKNTMEVAVKLANNIVDGMDIVGVEKIVFDHTLRIAGTIDLLARSKKNGSLWILDHKTNKKIVTENTYNSFALDPIRHIGDLNYWHYNLQLNLYEYILKRAGYIDENEKVYKALFHITENDSTIYKLTDLQKEIKDMIKYDGRPIQ